MLYAADFWFCNLQIFYRVLVPSYPSNTAPHSRDCLQNCLAEDETDRHSYRDSAPKTNHRVVGLLQGGLVQNDEAHSQL